MSKQMTVEILITVDDDADFSEVYTWANIEVQHPDIIEWETVSWSDEV
jgi:hypothetical protein